MGIGLAIATVWKQLRHNRVHERVIKMKKIDINIIEPFKLYKKDSAYTLEGDLIVLSGINGSGKSQLLQIIAKNGKEQISRTISQTDNNGDISLLENILLLSFRDNINLGQDFGQFSVTYKQNYANNAWEYYRRNIKHDNNSYFDAKKTKKYNDGTLIFDDKGIKNGSWRSINRLVGLL